MANHPSALKRERQAQKRRIRNRAMNSRVKTAIKKVLNAISESGAEAIKTTLRDATSTLDKAASKGVIPKKRASRKISRLTLRANKATSAPESTDSTETPAPETT